MYTTLISAAELKRHLNEPAWLVIDCRFSLADTELGRRAYLQEHIPGAVYAHLDKDLSGPVAPGKTSRHPLPEIEDLAQTFSNWGIDERVQVVAYDDAGGMIAARLWWMLRWLGHERAAVLDGGLPYWKQSELPRDNGIPQRTESRFVPRPKEEYLVDAAFVEAIRKDPQYRLVDSRAKERFLGETELLDPVAGHIPGAVNAPHAENAADDGRFLPLNALQKRFSAILKNTAPEKTVFYCGSGVSACCNLLAFTHAGLGDARLYAGSWSEWITDPGRAVGKN